MSDDDDFMMEEDEEFDFEYDESGDDGADGEGDDADMGDVGLENKYYGAKGIPRVSVEHGRIKLGN